VGCQQSLTAFTLCLRNIYSYEHSKRIISGKMYPPNQLHFVESLKVFDFGFIDIVGQELVDFVGRVVGDAFQNILKGKTIEIYKYHRCAAPPGN